MFHLTNEWICSKPNHPSCLFSSSRVLSQAYHRYALNYINALNYLETLRRQQEFCEFEKVSSVIQLGMTVSVIFNVCKNVFYARPFSIETHIVGKTIN